ncbi:MAG: hypothetical protein ACYTEX_14245 [Planctomycetota bacterium]|jgi:hypothetical protein
MCKKIALVVPLVLVLALVVSVSISAPGKVALTDAQMSSVYGGCDCKTHDNDGCDPQLCFLDCSYWPEWFEAGCEDPNTELNCRGAWQTSCKQEQKRCKAGETGGCTNSTTACMGTVEWWSCGYGPPPEHDCEKNGPETFYCPGTKLWCYD